MELDNSQLPTCVVRFELCCVRGYNFFVELVQFSVLNLVFILILNSVLNEEIVNLRLQ